ncbi:MAG: ABC transporter permease [archaeon]|nr:ABC transporter permease [archaeon]MCP8320324.1 ABC transporter permease [archaeon]
MVSEIIEGLIEALKLIFSGDPTIVEITTRSILISGTATLFSALWGTPIGMMLGLKNFRGKTVIKSLFNALLGIPTVALGLILYLLFSRSGPLGFLQILYTPIGIVIGQAILITPIIVSLITSAIESVDPEIRDLARTLGASRTQASAAVLVESSSGFLLAIIASFNRAIAELGIALMIGGNIRGITRVLTTTIALETTRGEVVLAIALAIILLTIVLLVSLSINLIQRRRA